MRKRNLVLVSLILFTITAVTVICACTGKTNQIYFDTEIESGKSVYRMYLDSLTTLSPKVITRPKDRNYTLSSSNPTIVKVDGAKLIALREGIVTLTATSDEKSATAEVIVAKTKPVTKTDAERVGGYLVTFITEYGSVAGQIVNPGESATEPEAIVRPNGYLLYGWYYDKDCTLKYDFSTPVNAHLTLYALWGYAEPTYIFADNGDGTSSLTAFEHPNVPYADITLPAEDNGGNPVTKISVGAFESNKNITSVTIPSSYTEIGESAFEDCIALKKVIVGENVKTIGANAFHGANALKEVSFEGAATEEIGEYAFTSCRALESIILPNSVKTIGRYAFAECSALKTVTLPDELDLIDLRTFYGCALESVDLKNVTAIYNEAFYGCTALKTITGYEHLTFVGSYVFGSLTREKSLATAWLKDTGNHTVTERFGVKGGTVIYLGDILVYVVPQATKCPMIYVKQSVTAIAGQAVTDAGKVTLFFQGPTPPTYTDASRPFGEQAETVNGTTVYKPTADIVVQKGYTEAYTRAFMHCVEDVDGYQVPTVYSFAVCQSINETVSTTFEGLNMYARKPYYSYGSGVHYNKMLAKEKGDPYAGITLLNKALYTIFDYRGGLETLDIKSILDSVTADGTPYEIAKIDAYAFSVTGLKLKEICLPTEILEIGEYAFGASTLTEINISGNTDFDPSQTILGSNAFNTNICKDLVIWVPKDMLTAYSKSSSWSKYNSIIKGV